MARTKKVSAHISETETSMLQAIGDAWESDGNGWMELTGRPVRTRAGEMKAAIYLAREYLRNARKLYQ